MYMTQRQGSRRPLRVVGLCYAKDMHSIRSSKKVSIGKHAERRMASTALGLANLSAQCVELILPKPKQDKWYQYDLTGNKLQPFLRRIGA